MKNPTSRLAVLTLLAAFSGVGGVAFGQTVTVVPAPSGITGLSDDGSVAVGFGGNSMVPGRIFYTTGGVTTRINTLPYGQIGNDLRGPRISGDGRIIQNSGLPGASYLIPRNGGPVTTIPGISGTTSFAAGLSYDGSVVAGTDMTQGGTFHQSWRWTAAVGRQNFGFGIDTISGDGNTIVGGDGTEAGSIVWRNGTTSRLLSPPEANNPFNSTFGVNYNGSIIVGYAGVYPTIWRNGQGAILPLLQGFGGGRATGTSNDGTVVVGLTSSEQINDVPFVWTPERGSELITSYLAFFGVDLSAYQIYNTPIISADGRTFGLTGQAYADQSIHGIVVTIPAPGAAVLVSFGFISLRRRR